MENRVMVLDDNLVEIKDIYRLSNLPLPLVGEDVTVENAETHELKLATVVSVNEKDHTYSIRMKRPA